MHAEQYKWRDMDLKCIFECTQSTNSYKGPGITLEYRFSMSCKVNATTKVKTKVMILIYSIN